MVGRYIKALQHNSWGSRIEVNKYYKIISITNNYSYNIDNGLSVAVKSESCYELMPEGFDPNNINNEIQYEIC